MTNRKHGEESFFKRNRWVVHLGISIVLVAGGVLGLVVLTYSKSEIKKEKPPVSLPLVRTLAIEPAPLDMRIAGEGTVRPMREVNLAAQVQGRVVQIADCFINGAPFEAGDTLVRIEPADYELRVTSARAKVKETLSKLKETEAESQAAREEWRMLNGNQDVPDLVAKAPQLTAAGASHSAAKADLEKALLDLRRTRITAPFNGRLGKKYVEVGEQVTPGEVLADLFCVDAAEIVVPFDDEALCWFHVPGFTPGSGSGAGVIVKTVLAGRSVSWRGVVSHAEGRIDPQTRMVNVVVRVENPYEKMPPLVPGLYVSVEILGRRLSDAVVMPRSAVHGNDRVWVIDGDDVLRFRKVKVARLHGDAAVLTSGLEAGEVIAVSPLKVVTDGMRVRTSVKAPSEKSVEKGDRS